MKDVIKTGSLWTGEVVEIDAKGNLRTNFLAAEIRPFESHAKLWFEFKNQQASIRGVARSLTESAHGHLVAVEGVGGFIEIALPDGSAAQKTGLKAGDSIELHFRT